MATKNKNGFTIVEVTIVVVIIAILAAISIVMYTKVQVDSRNSERSSKVAIIASALEKYYIRNGEYPSCSAMMQSGAIVSTTVLSGIDPNALVIPNSPAGTTNSISCTSMTSGSGPDVFAYVGDGSASCNSGAACIQYTLQYRQEGSGNVIATPGIHKSNITTSTVPTLSVQSVAAAQVNLTWTPVDGAATYKMQAAKDVDFSVGLVEVSSSGVTGSVTSLTTNTLYYLRVVGMTSGGQQGTWSNTVTATPSVPPPSTPVISASLSGSNVVGTVAAATCTSGTPEYQIQYRSTATVTPGAWSGWSAWQATLTRTQAASEGYNYDFQTQARCNYSGIYSTTSAASNIAAVVRPINTPAVPTYLSPASFKSNVYAIVNYASYCPSGTTLDSTSFRTRAWNGVTGGPHPFGFNDDWTNTTGSNKNIEYWGKYRCLTTYSTSAFTAESYNVVVVTP